jgi:pyruvate dehydrogenase E1 component alpha subunit
MSTIASSTLLDIYRRMTTIKQNDDRFVAEMSAGRITMTYYSARGQECIPAGISTLLTNDDYLCTIYRGIHDMIAKGVPPKVIWAELAGRSTGCCKGKGGAMHITHPESGCMVTTGIVGASMPIATGMALASQLRGDKRVTVTNFGDGASNIGAFHESLNLASLWKLPVIFVCQNNQFAEHTAYENCTTSDTIAERAKSYNMPGFRVDGNDPVAVYEAATVAIERARAGDGPTLLEFMTFRFRGHLVGDPGEYIPKEMMAKAKAKDPVPLYRQRLIDEGHGTAADLDAIDAEIKTLIDEAVEFAYSSPKTDASEVFTDVYAA